MANDQFAGLVYNNDHKNCALICFNLYVKKNFVQELREDVILLLIL